MKRLLLLILILVLGAGGLLTLRYRHFAARPRPIAVVNTAEASPQATATVPVQLASQRPDAGLQARPALGQALALRYPGLLRRFPAGVELTLVSRPLAPEPLRAAYDENAAALLLGAVYPLPQPGDADLHPQSEAWAGCRRDLELGPASQLRCYVYVRGETGPVLARLAVLAWVQALDVTLSGRAQAFDPTTLPYFDATQETDPWSNANAWLSLSFAP